MYSLFICIAFIYSQVIYSSDSTSQFVSIDKVQANLVEIANSINHSLKELHAMEKSAHPERYKEILAKGMQDAKLYAQKISIDWAGPIEPLLQNIAQQYHYQLNVLGRAPAIPVLIHLSEQHKALGEVLKNIDWQAGMKANISIASLPTGQVIELRYV